MHRTTPGRDPVAALAALAAVQLGVATRGQLLACGVPARTVYDRCRPGGPWQRPLPHVIALHNGPLSWQQRYWAALLYVGRRGSPAVVTGTAALALYRLDAAPAPEDVGVVDVLAPVGAGSPSHRWVRVRRTRRMPRRVRMNDGIVAGPLLRAAVDAVRAVPGEDTAAVLYEVVQARRVDPQDLAAELRATRLTRAPGVGEVLDDLGVGVRSPAEGLARGVVEGAGLPAPLWNPRLYLDGEWLADPDAYWPRHGVILEVDSVRYHDRTMAQRDRTLARHNRIEAAGLLVLHATPRQLRRAPEEVVAAVRGALATGPHGPWRGIASWSARLRAAVDRAAVRWTGPEANGSRHRRGRVSVRGWGPDREQYESRGQL